MGDELDVDAMLEAPFRKEGREDKENGERKSSRSERRKRSKDRHRSRSREKKSHRTQERKRSRDRKRSRSRERRRRSKSKERRREPTPEKIVREPSPELTVEERDRRTVFCMQLAQRLRSRDLEEFFTSVGKVRDVRIITDNRTRRSKGIAYVEFREESSVPLAIGLSGQKVLGVPIIVQSSMRHLTGLASSGDIYRNTGFGTMTSVTPGTGSDGPLRVYVGSLHSSIVEDMIRKIFEPFGKIIDVTLTKDAVTGQSRGFGFISFARAEDGRRAIEQLNGFDLAGRAMRVSLPTASMGAFDQDGFGYDPRLDSDDTDRRGLDLGVSGRLQLMAKLARGTGLELPHYAQQAMVQSSIPQVPLVSTVAPPIATQCFMLSNMFDPSSELASNWEQDIRNDVIEECDKHGGCVHIYVDRASPEGNVYVKCSTILSAVASVNSLHGRYFGGKIISANYVPVASYTSLFPDTISIASTIKS